MLKIVQFQLLSIWWRNFKMSTPNWSSLGQHQRLLFTLMEPWLQCLSHRLQHRLRKHPFAAAISMRVRPFSKPKASTRVSVPIVSPNPFAIRKSTTCYQPITWPNMILFSSAIVTLKLNQIQSKMLLRKWTIKLVLFVKCILSRNHTRQTLPLARLSTRSCLVPKMPNRFSSLILWTVPLRSVLPCWFVKRPWNNVEGFEHLVVIWLKTFKWVWQCRKMAGKTDLVPSWLGKTQLEPKSTMFLLEWSVGNDFDKPPCQFLSSPSLFHPVWSSPWSFHLFCHFSPVWEVSSQFGHLPMSMFWPGSCATFISWPQST